MNIRRGTSTVRVLLAIVAVLMTSGLLTPATIVAYELGSTDGTWSNARTTGGATPSCLNYRNTPSTTDENVVAYGKDDYYGDCPPAVDLSKQSGFGFQGVQNVPFIPGATFAMGEFVHYNRPIYITNMMELVDLAVDLNFSDPPVATTLNYTMRLDETPNEEGECPYPGVTPCSDKVDFADTFPDEVFVVGGVFYTLQVVGFVPGTLGSYDPSATPINQFITEEGQENHAVLIGRIIVAEPSISLTKMVTTPIVHEGDPVLYTFDVLNDGDVDLDTVMLSDPLLDSLLGPFGDDGDGILNIGETWTYTGEVFSAPSTGFMNIAEVTAQAVDDGVMVSDTDTAEFRVIHPDIDLAKLADVSTAHAGDLITYQFAVTNTGDVELDGIGVFDPLPGMSPIVLVFDGDGDWVLSPGEFWIFEATLVAGSSDIANTAMAEGFDPLGLRVEDTSDELVEIINPDITLVKTVDPTVAQAGEVVTYTLVAENTGDTPLFDIQIDDGLAGLTLGSPDESGPNDNVMQVGETWTWIGELTVVGSSDIYNLAIVSGEDELGLRVVDEDDALVDVINPAIAIDKIALVPVVGIGESIDYQITVTNIGDVTLHNVMVTDPMLGISINVGDLAPGLGTMVPGTYGPVTEGDLPGPIVNVATADSDEAGPVSDDAVVAIRTNPAIAINKIALVPVVGIGDSIDYQITVTNIGDVTLHNVMVTDPMLSISTNVGDLAPGASTMVPGTYGPVTEGDLPGPIVNTATADSDEAGPVSDDAVVQIVTEPGLMILKLADRSVVGLGETINYTIRVTNSGDITLTNVRVTDTKLGLDVLIPLLSPGASQEVYGSYGPVDEGDLPGPIVNIATANSDQFGPVEDDAVVEILTNPMIAIDKVALVSVAGIGDSIDYQITVTNIGDVTLHNVMVTDPMLGISTNVGDLAPGASTMVPGTYGPVTEGDLPGPIVNTATADSDEAGPVSDDAVVAIRTNPAIAIDKIALVSVVGIGESIDYQITVTNIGDVTLHNVMVTDPMLGISTNVGDLVPGASTMVPGTYGPVTEGDLPGPIVNTAMADSDEAGPVSDDAVVQLVTEPGLAINKTGPAMVFAGDSIEYTITVTNTGNVTLHNVVITDTKIGLVATLPELAVGASEVLTGIYGPVGELDQPGPIVNVATADSDEAGPVSDDHSVEIEQPFEPRAELEIVKVGDAVVNVGDMINYTILVTNIGNVDLNNVRVTDAKLGLDQTIVMLAVGASETIYGTYGPVTEADAPQVVNTAIADSDETDPEEDDWTTVVVTTPGLAITKTGPTKAEVGDVITYQITVMNTGDITLHNVVVTDARLGYTETLLMLAPGASVVLTVNYGPIGEADLPGPINNTAIAEADEAGPVQDTWSVELEVPYEEPLEPCERSDVSVVIYGGWDDIPVRAWVGGSEQTMLYTKDNMHGESQVMWTLYPPEGGSWKVEVAPELPSGLDPERWEFRLIRIESPTEGWSTENPSSAMVTVRRCNQYVIYYQLYDKGPGEEIVTPPVLPETGALMLGLPESRGLALWLRLAFLWIIGIASLAGIVFDTVEKRTQR